MRTRGRWGGQGEYNENKGRQEKKKKKKKKKKKGKQKNKEKTRRIRGRQRGQGTLYGAETWTLRRSEEKRIEAIEIWIWGRMERVKWTKFNIMCHCWIQKVVVHMMIARKTEEVHGLSVTGSTWRIDIIAFKESTRSGFTIDPTVRFETNEEQPAEVEKEKKNIYNPIIPYHLQKYHLEELEVIGLLVGARGTATLFMKDVTGYVANEPRSGRPSVPEQTAEHIREAIERNPQTSSRRLSNQLDIPRPTVLKVLQFTPKKQAYHIQVLQIVHMKDYAVFRQYKTYLDMLEHFLESHLQQEDIIDIVIFQQDGEPPHFALLLRTPSTKTFPTDE
ncbi:hypothetical protein ANN_08276 [Periplaneta americana]|uniref:Uncharacterized protein n=1 Tax=Periplaneta americana TaxID=6978 RepID=A0ABQ8T1M3_PERAM|nr:hypothetical protein ANN_08276 [Periplaneta americana]